LIARKSSNKDFPIILFGLSAKQKEEWMPILMNWSEHVKFKKAYQKVKMPRFNQKDF
jgi:hypothetical protein